MAFGQTPVNVPPFGRFACAAIRRPANQVQTYCYAYPRDPVAGWVLGPNHITPVPTNGAQVIDALNTCNAVAAGAVPGNTPIPCTSADIITWSFWIDGSGAVHYDMTHDGATLAQGTLP